MRDPRCDSEFLEIVLKANVPHITKLENEIGDLEECEKRVFSAILKKKLM